MATYTQPDPKHAMRLNLQFLREYAKRIILDGDESLRALDDVKAGLLEEVWKAGDSFQLTQRDVVILLYKGVLPKC
jgi:hypothetical protein